MPRHPRKCRDIDASDFFKKMADHIFENTEYIFPFYKRHFTIDLSEFRLTVCPKVLVPETFHNLIVSVETGDHQQLFESLRALR